MPANVTAIHYFTNGPIKCNCTIIKVEMLIDDDDDDR